MVKKTKNPSFQTQATQHIEEQALQIARATQSPGQTKEQTKLISKGIAKGIAQYKKQEKLKQRTRNKLQRKSKNKTSAPAINDAKNPHHNPAENTRPGTILWPLRVAAVIFFLVAVLHLARYAFETTLLIGSFTVPVFWSLPVAIGALILAAWMYTHN